VHLSEQFSSDRFDFYIQLILFSEFRKLYTFKIVIDLVSISIIVIDEISFVGPNSLHIIDARLKSILNNPKPFGGMGIIFCGDFSQLPPVKAQSLANFTNISAAFRVRWNGGRCPQLDSLRYLFGPKFIYKCQKP
jgi:hypothetical protein